MINIPEEEKMKIRKKLIITFLILLIALISFISYVIIKESKKPEYSMILDGEEVEEFMICEDFWHYEHTEFLPCVYEGNLTGLYHNLINWSLSPIENCKLYNATFPGFNVKNETLAREQYDILMPKCATITTEDIDNNWIDENCFCAEYCSQDLCYFTQENSSIESVNDLECSEYECGANLRIKKE